MKIKNYFKTLIPLLFLLGSFAIFNSAQARPTTEIYLDGSFSAEVTENQAIGTVVGIITDSGSSNNGYTLACGTPGFDDIHFQIVGNELQTATVFDYDNPVDVGNDNTYTICISSTIDGSPQEQTFTVDVTEEDLVAPTVTINGDTSVAITVGDTYIDAGATCADDVDPTCTVVTVNNVDTSTPGTYTVTYNAQDDAGNDADEVIRTVIVEKKAAHKSSSRRLSRAEVNTIFGIPTETTTTGTSSTNTVQQIQQQLISLITQLLAIMRG